MKKIFLNQEKGLALSMAITVMLALFLIATAYFISTQNECSNILLNKAKVKAIEVASVGAERALWDIQQRLDKDPNWQPTKDEIPLLYTDYNYFRNPDRNPYNYAKKCVQVGATKSETEPEVTSVGGVGSQVYAVKMRREDNPDTPDVVEWAIYALGIERTTGVLSKMNMQAVKVVVQLGTSQEIDFHTMYNGEGDEEVKWYKNASIQIDGRDNLAKVYTSNSINDTAEGNTSWDPQWDDPQWTDLFKPSPTDGINKKSQFILSYLQKTPPLKLPNTTGIDITLKSVTTPPSFPEIDFNKIPADYTAEQLLMPDPITGISRWIKVPEVHNGKTYYHYEFNTIPLSEEIGYSVPVVFVNSMATMESEINRLNEIYGAGLSNAKDYHPTTIYEDRNGDGFVVIKIPEDDYNLRVGNYINNKANEPPIMIFPNTHVIIVAEGSGCNRYTSNPMGAGDNELNTNVSIEFRTNIRIPPFLWRDSNDIFASKQVNYYVDDNGNPKIGPDITTVSDEEGVNKVVPVVQPEDRMLGTLDILAKNDVIFGRSGAGNKFRGLVYSSNGKVEIGEDMFLQGSISAKKGVYWQDEGALKGQQYAGGDGIDTALWHENPLQRITDEKDRNPSLSATWFRGGGVGTGNIRIISWENIGKIKDTFGN